MNIRIMELVPGLTFRGYYEIQRRINKINGMAREKRDIPSDVIYYQYTSKYPHHGTGSWILF